MVGVLMITMLPRKRKWEGELSHPETPQIQQILEPSLLIPNPQSKAAISENATAGGSTFPKSPPLFPQHGSRLLGMSYGPMARHHTDVVVRALYWFHSLFLTFLQAIHSYCYMRSQVCPMHRHLDRLLEIN